MNQYIYQSIVSLIRLLFFLVCVRPVFGLSIDRVEIGLV